MSDGDQSRMTEDDAALELAQEIVGTTWIPIRRQRLDLEIRIAEALMSAEARAQAAERDLEQSATAAYRDGEAAGYESGRREDFERAGR